MHGEALNGAHLYVCKLNLYKNSKKKEKRKRNGEKGAEPMRPKSGRGLKK